MLPRKPLVHRWRHDRWAPDFRVRARRARPASRRSSPAAMRPAAGPTPLRVRRGIATFVIDRVRWVGRDRAQHDLVGHLHLKALVLWDGKIAAWRRDRTKMRFIAAGR